MKLFLLPPLAVLLLTLTVGSVNGQDVVTTGLPLNDVNVNVNVNDESLVTVIEPQIEQPVCPFDYILLKSSIDNTIITSSNGGGGGGGEEEGVARRRRQLQQESSSSPPIQIIRQAGSDDESSNVEFTIQNTTSWLNLNNNSFSGDLLPNHIFTILETGPFGSQHCIMDENLLVVSNSSTISTSTNKSSSSEIMKAHCFGASNYAIIRTYVRYSTASASASTTTTAVGDVVGSDSGIIEIPKCCQDPYANEASSGDYAVIEYVFELKCTPSCDNPEEYFGGETNGTNDDETDDLIVIIDRTASPTVMDLTLPPTPSPTTMFSLVPTETVEEDCTSNKKKSSLLRDTVTGSLLNGPHWGSRHGWAWPAANNNGCTRYDNIGSGSNGLPCSVNRKLLNRILQFKSSYMKVNIEFDNSMKTIITLPNGMGTDTVSLYPSGGGSGTTGSTAAAACTPPNDYSWNDYPLRLVRSGRYLHHWYAETVGCNGATSAAGGDTRIEIKVTPDCVELYMVSTKGAAPMNWITSDGDNVSSTNGFAGISYCVKCNNDDNDDSDLSGCSIVKVPIPADCCPLSGATIKDGIELCGTGFTYETCDATQIGQVITTPYTEDISVSTTYPTSYPIIGDGHSYEIRMPRGSGGQMDNDVVRIKINNNDNNQKWKKVKLKFHIEKPKRITGVNGILRDPITMEPTGIHIQMSKNWHENLDALYNSYWWDGIAHVRVPSGVTELELVIAYQYYDGLHAVSHSQLSLLGWATNGLWEEVGLGANGESITYEPHGHHRRQMILDTRPWLVCAMNRDGCVGSPDSTQWTENVGGGDFLNAVDKKGMYQYLLGDTTFHTMNGPRLTNATYEGVTVDTNIAVSRTVSTSTADDFVRHLHSFKYIFLKETDGDNYPRFALYTLGGDNYNYVEFPIFAYGMGEDSVLDSVPIKDVIGGVSDFHYTDYYQVEAPNGCSSGGVDTSSCWFAMLTDPSQNIHQRGHRGIIVRNFHGQLDGKPWPPTEGDVSPFTFNLIKSRQNGSAQNTASIELGLPSSFIAAVDAGQAKFREGDYLSADIELLVPPRQTVDYFGKSQRLKDWLAEAGVDQDYQNGWKVIAKEAVGGDALKTTVFQGVLERKYHPRVHVDCSDEARFNIQIPDGMPGILPITIAGVGSSDSFPTSLLGRPEGKMWRLVSGSWKEFRVGGNYQLEKDVVDNSYTFVYSLRLEFESDPVGDCEQFYFGVAAPSDSNPSCDAPL